MKIVLRRKNIFWLAPVVLVLLLGAFVIPLVSSPQKAEAAAPADPLVGFGAGTTGGAGGPTVTVSNLSSFTSAVSDSNPRIVLVQGMITLSSVAYIGSNKSIIGVGTNSGFTGSGLEVKSNQNVIFQNLNVSYSVSQASIRIWGSNHIWIDHNNLYSDLNHGKDYYDGLINITKGSDDVTVSWNRLALDYETSLIGAADTDGSLDIGHEHVTYHHNWFYDVNSRTPSLRFGTGHIYNNYFDTVNNGIHSRMGAQMLIENNVFRNTGTAITTTGASVQDGYANQRGNDFGGAAVDITQIGTFTQAPYAYTLDPTSSVISEVTAYAGPQGGSGGGGGNPTPTPVPPTPQPTATPVTTATPVATATPQPTSTPTSGSSCKVSYAVQNQWVSGFTTNVTIANTGSTSVNGWTLAFTFANGQQITEGWNGVYTQSGSSVSVKDAGYNATIAPGSTVSTGFNGSWTGSNANPTSFTLNGATCS